MLSQYTDHKLQENQQFKKASIDHDGVISMLRKLNVNKSTGIDSLEPRILKLAAPVIVKPIANMGIKEGIFPDDLKAK